MAPVVDANLVSPTMMLMVPAWPSVERPLPTMMSPLAPLDAMPELKIMPPVTPADASSDVIVTLPDDVDVP